MNLQHPVYTELAKCRDCYKCVRHCPVKAIRVEKDRAAVIPEECIACGHCVAVCPVGAKRVRSDLARVRRLLRDAGGPVVASLAPSYAAEFPGVPAPVLIQALKRLGFAGVSETALGAQDVSAAVAVELRDPTPRVLLSSACPAVVELVLKHAPQHAERITSLCSPLLAHCRRLKREISADTRIVFIGPCIAKKLEADAHPDLLEAALTFADLREWLEAEQILLDDLTPAAAAAFIPRAAEEGALYPVDGGMIAGIRAGCACTDAEFMTFSGLDTLREALAELGAMPLQRPLFLELLACAGGCINGPCVRTRGATVLKRHRVLEQAPRPAAAVPRPAELDVFLPRRAAVPAGLPPEPHSRAVADALAAVGKYRAEDELNCGGCGYAGCRDFAAAMAAQKAEKAMCVSYMRKLAQKKANALIKAMPSGVVIADDTLNVVECNRRFAGLLGDDALRDFDARPGLEGAPLAGIAPFLLPYFTHVLRGGEDVLRRNARHAGRVFQFSVFTVEKARIAGAILRDITEPAVQKEQVVRQARAVIRKNLATVQKIAYLLGENAAESQASLNDIITSFAPEPEAPEDNATE